ncbi:hypothetical protein JCM8547_004477 [Rhodosporidiobolus lusitaniae]
MFSSGTTGTPRQSRRLASRALASGQTTPRASPPSALPASHAARTLGANLQAASRALSVGSPGPGSARSGRLTPSAAGGGRSVAATSEAGGQMDVEYEGGAGRKDSEKVLVRDESYQIAERKGVPDEVVQAVQGSDAYTQPVKAVLDPITGFALLVTCESCFVWNWSTRTNSTTTYVFPVPPSASLPSNITAFSPLSFASLVPASSQTTQREPGLLLCSTTGSLRYWDSLSLALSGVDRFKSSALNLSSSVSGETQELVREMTMLSPSTYLLSTSRARVFVVSIVSTSGRTELVARPLERQVGWAGSLFSAVFGSGGKAIDPRAGILALAVAPPSSSSTATEKDRLVYAVQEKSVQIWAVPSRGGEHGGERLLGEQDIFHALLSALASEGEKVGNEHWAMNEGQVEVLDAKVMKEGGELAVLVQHVERGVTKEGMRSFAVVRVEVGQQQGQVEVKGMTELAYQAHPDPRPLSTPRLHLGPSSTAFITFADAVVICSLSISPFPFEESFPLRSPSHRLLGYSLPSYLPSPPSSSPTTPDTLTLLTSTPSLLTVSVSFPSPRATVPDKTRKLQTRLEQAVFFGASPSSSASSANGEVENPLAFDLPPEFEGDLARAAEGVSAGILASSSPNMPLILDLRAQLADRMHRARALIEFINANGLLGKLPQTTRRQLSWDAERLAAAAALWHHQNGRLGATTSPLAEAILTYMDEIGEGFGEDPLRLFFRTKTSALVLVLEEVSKQAKAVVTSSAASSLEKSLLLQEANQIHLLAFTALTRHRAEAPKLYGLDPSTLPSEPWSSRPSLLESQQWHFDATDSLLRERVRDFGANVDAASSSGSGIRGKKADFAGDQQAMQAELKRQMSVLAEVVFEAYEERLLFLSSASGGAGSTPEERVLEERYLGLRPRVVRTLVAIGKVPAAFQLAEKHRDFDSLVELANDSQHGSRSKVKLFLDKYAKEFAFPLYRFYLAQGQRRTLLEPLPEHRHLLTSFLDATAPGNDKLAWVNDVAIDRYEHATEALAGTAVVEEVLEQKKLMLSLSKITRLATVPSLSVLSSEQVQRALEPLDDALDLVNAQQGLHRLFGGLMSGSELALGADEKGEALVERVAPALGDRPALAQHYAKLIGSVFAGQALTAEDLIDLFTLKENVGEQAGDFATALDVLVRAKDLPESRKKVALESIWRRVYIQDDWASLKDATGLSDDEVAGALRNTAFYATLAAAAGSGHPPSLFLEAPQSFSSCTTTELSARHPTLPRPTLDLILNDYEQEGRVLGALLQDAGLEAFAKEVIRMLQEGGEGGGAGEDEEGDASMLVEE